MITGPLFAQRDDWMEPTKRVAVPDQYFRALVRQEGGGVRALAFILPNWKEGRPDGDTRRTPAILQDHLRSIQDVIDAGGVELFPDMDTAQKERLTREPERVLWSVAQP